MKSILLESVTLVLILIGGAFFRLQHLDWDHGYLFHPDERQILLVTSSLALPSSVGELFSVASPLNPRFFSYGSFPIYLLRLIMPVAPATEIVTPWQDPGFGALVLAGRTLSGIFDLGTVIFIFLIGRTLYDVRVGMIASACYAVTVTAIQLSHFYTVDTLVTFFTTGAFYFIAEYAITGRTRDLVAQGLLFGFALASKITAIPLFAPIVFGIILVAARQGRRARTIATNALASTVPRTLEDYWQMIQAPLGIVLTATLIVFILTQPYVLIDLPKYASDVYRETLIARGLVDVPYTRQYANTLPFIYQIQESTNWGLGLALGSVMWFGTLLFALQWLSNREGRDSLVLLWATTYFLFIGEQYVKYLRYLLPVIPILLLMASRALVRAHEYLADLRKSGTLLGWIPAASLVIGIGGGIIWASAFTSIYSNEHVWLMASRWIYRNVTPSSSILIEQWDEPLPELLLENGQRFDAISFHIIQNQVFDAEDSTKTERLVRNLREADYIVLASQRGYGALPRLSSSFPITTRYYEGLFDGRLGFEPVYVNQSVLAFANLAFKDDPFAAADLVPPVDSDSPSYTRVWNLGHADESFTVYDHPMTIVFRKTRLLSLEELRGQLAKR